MFSGQRLEPLPAHTRSFGLSCVTCRLLRSPLANHYAPTLSVAACVQAQQGCVQAQLPDPDKCGKVKLN